MAAVVPQLMNTEGKLVPMENAQTLPDNSTGQNIPETAIGLCNEEGNFDQQRNNQGPVQIFNPEARTKAILSAPLVNYNARGIQIDLGITAAGSGHLILSVLGIHGNTAMPSISPITGILNHIFTIYPGIAQIPEPVGGVVAGTSWATISGVIGRQFYIEVVPSEEVSWTYSLAYQLIL